MSLPSCSSEPSHSELPGHHGTSFAPDLILSHCSLFCFLNPCLGLHLLKLTVMAHHSSPSLKLSSPSQSKVSIKSFLVNKSHPLALDRVVLKLCSRNLRAVALCCMELDIGKRKTWVYDTRPFSPALTNASLLTVFIAFKHDFCLGKKFYV